MTGHPPFLFGWLPGRDLVGALGEQVTSQFPVGMERQVAQLCWVALVSVVGFLALRTLLRFTPRAAPVVARTGALAVHGGERLMLWVDYRIVTGCRLLGVKPLYWTSEAIVILMEAGQRVASTPPALAAVGRRRAGWLALVVTVLALLSWNYSVCVPGAGEDCVDPGSGWWRFTMKLST